MIALSEVDDEYEEMLLKATSVLRALGHGTPPGRQGPPGSEPARSRPPPPPPSPPSEPKAVASQGGRQGVVYEDTSPANSVIGGRSIGAVPSLGSPLRGGGSNPTGEQPSAKME